LAGGSSSQSLSEKYYSPFSGNIHGDLNSFYVTVRGHIISYRYYDILFAKPPRAEMSTDVPSGVLFKFLDYGTFHLSIFFIDQRPEPGPTQSRGLRIMVRVATRVRVRTQKNLITQIGPKVKQFSGPIRARVEPLWGPKEFGARARDSWCGISGEKK
jgi:hypothetical protein